MNGAPYFLHSGPSVSIRPGSPLMELTSGEPGHASSPARIASGFDESRHSGVACFSESRSANAGRTAGSSTMAAPTFTSRMDAPSRICSSARRRARPNCPA